MKVFISWSGEASRELAQLLAEWMKSVVQSVQPFMSDTDIALGQRWSEKLASELADTHFGVICLTPDNMDKPWLHFEAGALSKLYEDASVAPLLFDLTPSDLLGPLKSYQGASFTKENVFRLLRSINNAAGNADERFGPAFEALWNDLDKAVKIVLDKYRPAWGDKSSANRKPDLGRVERIVEEILGIVRAGPEFLQSDLRLESQRSHLRDIASLLSRHRYSVRRRRRWIAQAFQRNDTDPEAMVNQMLDGIDGEIAEIGQEVSKARAEIGFSPLAELVARERHGREEEEIPRTEAPVPKAS